MATDSPSSVQKVARDSSAARVARMNRRSLIRMLRRLDCGFKVDFTDEFLAGVSMQRLRHIVLAAVLQAGKLAESQQP
jgi:hypothetical protein